MVTWLGRQPDPCMLSKYNIACNNKKTTPLILSIFLKFNIYDADLKNILGSNY